MINVWTTACMLGWFTDKKTKMRRMHPYHTQVQRYLVLNWFLVIGFRVGTETMQYDRETQVIGLWAGRETMQYYSETQITNKHHWDWTVANTSKLKRAIETWTVASSRKYQ